MRLFFASAFSLFFISCFAQTSTVSIGDDFKLMSNYTTSNATGYSVIPIYKSNNIDGNPFFSTSWLPGSVVTKDGKTFDNRLQFMFDKYDNSLYYKEKDSTTIMKIDLSLVSSFTINSDKPHLFMPAGIFSKDYTGQFFEVLLFDNKYSFLKLTQTTLQKPAYSEVAQVVNNAQNSKFVDKVSYFLYTNGKLQPIELKKKDFIKGLDADAAGKAEAYYKDNDGKFNEMYVINMLDDINK
jgi:hypothetical protein